MVNNKVFGLDISEKEYRAIPLPSYSFLSDIQKLEEIAPGTGCSIIGGIPNTDVQDEDGLIFGTITDQVLSDGKPNDDIVVLKKKPSGKMKEMIKILVNIREYLEDPNNILSPINSKSILNIAEEFSYKKKETDRLNGFYNYEDYIKALSDIKNSNSIITTSYHYNTAIKMANEMLGAFPILSGNYMEKDVQVFRQVKLQGKIGEVWCKGMLDFVLINNSKKIIVPIDIKTGANRTEDFEKKGYFGWNYYIQSTLYRLLLQFYVQKFHPELSEYEIKPFTFIFGDRIKGGVIRFDVTDEKDNEALKEGFPKLNKLSVTELLNIYYENKPSKYDDYVKDI